MRPSMSVLEPGLERGVPWGRDLYTFVTSAAGHMMRTLQKPRKSRPSKRQVNHRRFLHNMIQRKFADIEAANHRLASAIYSKEGEKSTPSLLSHKQETPGNPPQGDSLQDAEKYSVPTDTDGILSSSGAADTLEADAREKQQPDSRHHWKSPHKFTCATRMIHQSKGTHTLDEFPVANSSKDKQFFHSECQLKPTSNLTEASQASPDNSSSILATQNENDSPFSSDFSPLSFDSCDFSIHMISSCSEAEKKNITEGHDLYSPGNFYSEGCMGVQDYFESICSCQDDARLDVCANNILVSDPPDNFTAGEDVFSEVGEYNYEYGCQENQEVMPNFFRDNQRSSHMQSELTQHQSSVMNQSPVSPSISCSHNITQLQTHQRFKEGGPYILVNNINLTPFEGVAQSFTAPPPPHHTHRSVPTPPREEDWLFNDIFKDRQSSYY